MGHHPPLETPPTEIASMGNGIQPLVWFLVIIAVGIAVYIIYKKFIMIVYIF